MTAWFKLIEGAAGNPQKAKWHEGPRRAGALVHALVQAQEGLCFHCEQPMFFDEVRSRWRTKGWSREHVYPKAIRVFTPNNIVLAHPRCNNVKGDRHPTPEEIEKTHAIYSRLGVTAFEFPHAFSARTRTPDGVQWVQAQ